MNFIRLNLLLLSVFSVLLYSGNAFAKEDCAGDNSLPMYGYNANHKENSCDKDFIDYQIKLAKGDRKKAYNDVLKLGWDYLFNKKDSATAIKRFNQAWLLDRNEFEVFWGFGLWEAIRGNMEKAEGFLEKAYAKNSKKPGLAVDYARVVMQLGVPAKDDARIRKVTELLKNAKSIDQNFIPAYVQSASLFINLKQYKKAWDEVEAAQKIKADAMPADLISDLERLLPRPKH